MALCAMAFSSVLKAGLDDSSLHCLKERVVVRNVSLLQRSESTGKRWWPAPGVNAPLGGVALHCYTSAFFTVLLRAYRRILHTDNAKVAAR